MKWIGKVVDIDYDVITHEVVVTLAVFGLIKIAIRIGVSALMSAMFRKIGTRETERIIALHKASAINDTVEQTA